jgi:cytochrome b
MSSRAPGFADPSSPLSTAAASGLPARRRVQVWDLPTRIFHWSLVAAVLTAVITGQIGGEWMRVHGIAGLVIVGLVVFRLVWGVVGPTHARFSHFAPTPAKVWAYLRGRWQGVGHNPLGAISVFVLLGLLATQATTGLFSNDDIAFTGPLAAWVSDELSARLTGWHHQVADVLLVFIGLHVVAIVFYAWVKKDNLVKPMVTGSKLVEAGSAEQDTEPPVPGGVSGVRAWASLLLAVTLALAAVYAASGAWREPAASAPATAETSPKQADHPW